MPRRKRVGVYKTIFRTLMILGFLATTTCESGAASTRIGHWTSDFVPIGFDGDVFCSVATESGLFLGGNFRGGISMADCFTQTHAMSARVADSLRPAQ